MQIHVEQRNVTVTGALKSRAYTLRPTAHLMSVLSGMYSDIPWAIVREYGTNMYDGMVKLAKLRPGAIGNFLKPVIKLPTKLSPVIEFTDYGIGMDHDSAWNVYAEYGASTKRDSNDEVGGLGIGSKVAHAYQGADTWTVESRYDGERHIFNAHKDHDGMPQFVHVASVPTDEPNGVTVKIPVRESDFGDFKRAVARFVRYFPAEIDVLGDAFFEAKRVEYALAGTGWGIRARDGEGCQVVMGNVPYPLEVGTYYNRVGLDYGFAGYNAVSLDLTVPIGAVDIVPSREALMYTDRTVAAVRSVVATFYAEAVKQAEASISGAATEWDALVALVQTWSVPGLRSRWNGIKWNGKELDTVSGIKFNAIDLLAEFPDLTVHAFAPKGRRGRTVGRTQIAEGSLHPDKAKLRVFVDDVKTGAVSRLRLALEGNDGRAFVFKATGLTPARLTEILRGHPVGLVSALAEPPKAPRQAGPRTKASVKRLYAGPHSGYWGERPVEVDLEEGGYFVRLHAGDIKDKDDGYVGLGTLNNVVTLARKLGLLKPDQHVYGIPRTQQRIEKLPGWVDFLDAMTRKVGRALAKEAQQIADLHAWNKTRGKGLDEFLTSLPPARLPQGSSAAKLAATSRAYTTAATRLDNLTSLADHLGVPTPEVPPSADATALVAAVKADYPMLAVVTSVGSSWQLKEHTDAILTYIHSV